MLNIAFLWWYFSFSPLVSQIMTLLYSLSPPSLKHCILMSYDVSGWSWPIKCQNLKPRRRRREKKGNESDSAEWEGLFSKHVLFSPNHNSFSQSHFSLSHTHTHSRSLILTVSQKDSDSCFAADRLLIRQLNVCSGLAPVFPLNTLRALSVHTHTHTHTHTYRSSHSPQSLMYVESQLSNYSLCHNILFV